MSRSRRDQLCCAADGAGAWRWLCGAFAGAALLFATYAASAQPNPSPAPAPEVMAAATELAGQLGEYQIEQLAVSVAGSLWLLFEERLPPDIDDALRDEFRTLVVDTMAEVLALTLRSYAERITPDYAAAIADVVPLDEIRAWIAFHRNPATERLTEMIAVMAGDIVWATATLGDTIGLAIWDGALRINAILQANGLPEIDFGGPPPDLPPTRSPSSCPTMQCSHGRYWTLWPVRK